MKKIRLVSLIALLALLCSCTGTNPESTTGITEVESTIPGTVAEETTDAVQTPEETTEAAAPETVPEETTDAVQTPEETTEAKNPGIFEAGTEGFVLTQEKVCAKEIIEFSYYGDSLLAVANTGLIVPALNQNFIPQGMDYWAEENVFIISGYFNPAGPVEGAVLLAVDADSGKYVGEWQLLETTGARHTGHDGGVAVTEKDIYLSTSSTLFRISLDQVRRVGNHGTLQFEENISVAVKASYCNYSYGMLWVGEFSLQGNSSYTISGHELDENHAWTLGYELDAEGKLNPVPKCVISTPEKIQGFTVLDDGRIYMSCSYGRTAKSYIYVSQKPVMSGEPVKNVKIGKKAVPIYRIGDVGSISVIPMAEGCAAVGNDVFQLFESGAYYYRDMSSSKAVDPTDCIWKITP